MATAQGKTDSSDSEHAHSPDTNLSWLRGWGWVCSDCLDLDPYCGWEDMDGEPMYCEESTCSVCN